MGNPLSPVSDRQRYRPHEKGIARSQKLSHLFLFTLLVVSFLLSAIPIVAQQIDGGVNEGRGDFTPHLAVSVGVFVDNFFGIRLPILTPLGV